MGPNYNHADDASDSFLGGQSVGGSSNATGGDNCVDEAAKNLHTIEAMDTILLNNNAVYLMRQGHEVISDFRPSLAKLHRVDQDEGLDLGGKVTPNLLSVRSLPLDLSLSSTSFSHQDHHTFSLFNNRILFTSPVASNPTWVKLTWTGDWCDPATYIIKSS
jgi:hypothetical protein